MKKFPGREFLVRNSREIPGSGIPDIGIDFTSLASSLVLIKTLRFREHVTWHIASQPLQNQVLKCMREARPRKSFF